jgi:hypothetical protein
MTAKAAPARALPAGLVNVRALAGGATKPAPERVYYVPSADVLIYYNGAFIKLRAGERVYVEPAMRDHLRDTKGAFVE